MLFRRDKPGGSLTVAWDVCPIPDAGVVTLRNRSPYQLMRESSTYQAVVEEGRLEEARRLLLLLGEDRFGSAPDARSRAFVDAIDDVERLERLLRSVLRMESWQDLRTVERAEGRAEGRMVEARRLLLLLGEKRFGAPDATIRATVEAINNVEQLERLVIKLIEVNSWQELLEPPPRPPRRGGRKSQP